MHLAVDLREAANIRHFTRNRLGLSEHQLRCVTWPEVARRIVEVTRPLTGIVVRSGPMLLQSTLHHIRATPGSPCALRKWLVLKQALIDHTWLL